MNRILQRYWAQCAVELIAATTVNQAQGMAHDVNLGKMHAVAVMSQAAPLSKMLATAELVSKWLADSTAARVSVRRA